MQIIAEGCFTAVVMVAEIVIEGILSIIGKSLASAEGWRNKLLIVLMWVFLACGCCSLSVFVISN